MEGRDIASKILAKNPKYDLAFYFKCNVKVASYRRWLDLKKKVSLKNVRRSLSKRTLIDKKRKNMVGSGDRSEKIRTYNFPQNRVTDHRIDFTSHNLEAFLDGEMENIFKELLEENQSRMLLNLENEILEN